MTTRTEWMFTFASCAERFTDFMTDDGATPECICLTLESAHRYWEDLGAYLGYPAVPDESPVMSEDDSDALNLYAWTMPLAVLHYAQGKADADDRAALPAELVSVWDDERAMLRSYIAKEGVK